MPMTHKAAIIGCGKILPRHIEAIEENDQFELVALCDTDDSIRLSLNNHNVPIYKDHKELLEKEDITLAVIATPNAMHYAQAKYFLENSCDVLIEKPATLNPELSRKLHKIAKDNGTRAYAVLQVRLNPVVSALKELLDSGDLGKVRGVSLTQRWQRPVEYFSDWRGDPSLGGGTLHECGIHYLDIMCHLFGKPKVLASSSFNTKHKNTTIEDTVYALFDFGHFGGTSEVTISSEPKNIECSISIMTEFCFIRLGGKSLDKILEAKFADNNLKIKNKYDKIISNMKNARTANSYGDYSGSCPNHPELYSKLEKFDISVSFECLELIEEIYKQCGRKYHE